MAEDILRVPLTVVFPDFLRCVAGFSDIMFWGSICFVFGWSILEVCVSGGFGTVFEVIDAEKGVVRRWRGYGMACYSFFGHWYFFWRYWVLCAFNYPFVPFIVCEDLFFYDDSKVLVMDQYLHNLDLEIFWTLLPSAVLASIALPSIIVCFCADFDDYNSGGDIKVEGHQWWWSYEPVPTGCVFDGVEPIFVWDTKLYMCEETGLSAKRAADEELELLKVDRELREKVHRMDMSRLRVHLEIFEMVTEFVSEDPKNMEGELFQFDREKVVPEGVRLMDIINEIVRAARAGDLEVFDRACKAFWIEDEVQFQAHLRKLGIVEDRRGYLRMFPGDLQKKICYSGHALEDPMLCGAFRLYFEGDFGFESNQVSEDSLELGKGRLDVADEHLIVPMGYNMHCTVSSWDVIHSWAVPAMVTKMDTIPGRKNESGLYMKVVGGYYGQCSELCGVEHGGMPIILEVVSSRVYSHWYLWSIKPYKLVEVGEML